MRTFLIIALLTAPVVAAEPQVTRDLPYAEPPSERQTLDVYVPQSGSKDRPIVFWIHGGGWQKGDKSGVKTKPQMFTDQGFVFVATNYRYAPNVTIGEMAGDVAQAIRWTHDHAEEFGGDRRRFVVAGHSAGAQLAALVSTDQRYLEAEGLTLSIIRACVPVDGDTYDAPLQIATVNERSKAVYTWKFGDPASQKELSPITHVAAGKGIPPIAVLHVATHPETKVQSETFVAALGKAGLTAKTIPAPDTDHVKLNDDLGLPGDKPTAAVLEFVADSLKK